MSLKSGARGKRTGASSTRRGGQSGRTGRFAVYGLYVGGTIVGLGRFVVSSPTEPTSEIATDWHAMGWAVFFAVLVEAVRVLVF
jgi:hypothetical protein